MPIFILEEPRGKKYQKIIEYSFMVCKAFVFSMRNDILTHYGKPSILKVLEPYKENEMEAALYPKINCYSEDNILYFYKCNEDTKLILMGEVEGLFEWREPGPEDLTFLNNKGDVWMDSISHERMAAIYETNRNEVEYIKNEIGLEIYWKEEV